MLTQIDVNSENAFNVPLLGATPMDSLLVKQITGLNPPEITLFIGDYARDGGSYQGRRVAKRNVVITFELNPNYALGETVSGLREMLYKAFMDPLVDADHLKLNLHDDELGIRYLVGYTEKFETELFAQENLVQISLLCPDPYIRDVNKIVLSEPNGWTTVPFTYRGTADTGFETEIVVTAPTSTLTLENNGKTMIFTRSLFAGDVITLNTNRGSRTLNLNRPGEGSLPLIGDLSPLSPWLMLHSQSNLMKVYGEDPTDIVAAVRKLSYVQTYWGV